jgi:hypothetical protein
VESNNTNSTIYLIDTAGKPVEMRAAEYEKESDFQRLLAEHHALMDGEQFDPESPRKWLLVAREVSVADSEGSRWSLDHLFLDQDAIPTLVEVKRKSDTRLRREVIAQMLDYAANASYSWSAAWLREKFMLRCVAEGRDAQQEVVDFLRDQSLSAETFWEEARANLAKGRMRLVFVADKIPPELTRIVEFLNEQMSSVEVLALELRYYAGGGYSTHIPRVYGHTARAGLQKAGSATRRTWDEASFRDDLERRLADQGPALEAIKKFLSGMGKEFQLRWGTGKDRGSFTPWDERLSERGPVSVYSDGELQVKTRWLRDSELALRWQESLRSRLASRQLRCDSGGEDASLHLAASEWYAHADDYLDAIVASRMEVLSAK